MKKVLLFTILALCCARVSAQTYIKTNALYWLGLLPNAQVETRLSNNFTFQGECNASLWKSINDRPMQGMQLITGARWYPREAFKGFYVGGDFGFDMYKVSKWDHPAYDIQHGIGYYLGVTLGYQLAIGRRWNMDFYAGGGWHLGKYYATNYGQMVVPWNASGEWIPYKIGVAFAYRLTSKKRMVKRFGQN